MSIFIDILCSVLVLVAAFFFCIGTLGLLRFPDIYTRLHSVTKADNLGLGLIAISIALQSGSVSAGCKILFIWILAMAGSTVGCHLLARLSLRGGQKPWKKI